jgi:hypothetical protein
VPRRCGFADLDPGGWPAGGPGDRGEQLVAVADAEGVVSGLDGQGPAAWPMPTWMRFWAFLDEHPGARLATLTRIETVPARIPDG